VHAVDGPSRLHAQVARRMIQLFALLGYEDSQAREKRRVERQQLQEHIQRQKDQRAAREAMLRSASAVTDMTAAGGAPGPLSASGTQASIASDGSAGGAAAAAAGGQEAKREEEKEKKEPPPVRSAAHPTPSPAR
jgi:hypothetical protein